MRRSKRMTFTCGFTFTCFLISFFLMAFPAATLAADKPIELKMSFEHGTKGGKYLRGHLPWSKMVEKATKGRIKMTLYPANSLAKSKENFDAMMSGIVDIGWFAIPHYPGRFPLTELFTLPAPGLSHPVPASEAAWRLYTDIPEIQKEWSEIKLLFFHGYIPQTVGSTKKLIRVPADVKGMKIRCAGRGITESWKAAGASPLYVRPPDIYLNLQKNVMEAAMIGWEAQKSFGITKLANYFTELPAFSGPIFAMGMSKKKWDQLPPDVQKDLWSVCGATGSKFYGKGDETSGNMVIEEVLKAKKTIVKLTPAESKQWMEIASGVRNRMLDELEKKGLPAKRIYAQFQEIVKQVNAKY